MVYEPVVLDAGRRESPFFLATLFKLELLPHGLGKGRNGCSNATDPLFLLRLGGFLEYIISLLVVCSKKNFQWL